jgi:hypothetical protein
MNDAEKKNSQRHSNRSKRSKRANNYRKKLHLRVLEEQLKNKTRLNKRFWQANRLELSMRPKKQSDLKLRLKNRRD